MENVPEVVGAGAIDDFKKWELKLSELGYTNHIQILNAKHYGIPQNRKRCFMVSILNGNFEFGGKMPLKYKLKDLLEDEVDEKYYLSVKWNGNKTLNETIEGKELEDADYIDAYNKRIKKDVTGTITTRVNASNMTFLVERKCGKK